MYILCILSKQTAVQVQLTFTITQALNETEQNDTSENAEQTPPQGFLEHLFSLLLEVILPPWSLI